MGAEQLVEPVFGVGVSLLLGMFGVGEAVDACRKFRLRSRGRWIEARLLRVREDDDGEGGARFYPVVSFTPPGGDEIVAESPHYKTYPPGLGSFPKGTVDVLYDPLKPERIEVRGFRGDGPYKAAITALLLFGGAALFLSQMVV
ncbi:DUF3592 domain-containing protein [Streptomyces sp. Root369]|uniref:DUF3592 domain-containing protein n=1 Tax=Streptomyces sp. Root369 TaxID=1736523 RepID=UPI00070DA44A|nr:DUF3592 domain-containing protein [Streptomyces sp. Root369]KQW13627.1 hypothetical protein ASD08_31185 [Streptomyces sp. Root369]